MTRRYATLAGASVVEVPWPGAASTEAVLAATVPGWASSRSPRPTTPRALWCPGRTHGRRAAARVGAVVLLDLAYVEFADADPTSAALQHDNVVVVRTVSKAWGLAGLRVGCPGAAPVLAWMAAAGAPYAVSAPSLALRTQPLRRGDTALEAFVASVRLGRAALAEVLHMGCTVVPSEANFVFARSERAAWIADGLAGLGIGSDLPRRPGADGRPAGRGAPDPAGLRRPLAGLQSVTAPQAVLVDTSCSWELSQEACGVPVVAADVSSRDALLAVSREGLAAWLVTPRPAGVVARAAGVVPLGGTRPGGGSDALRQAPRAWCPILRLSRSCWHDSSLCNRLADHP